MLMNSRRKRAYKKKVVVNIQIIIMINLKRYGYIFEVYSAGYRFQCMGFISKQNKKKRI